MLELPWTDLRTRLYVQTSARRRFLQIVSIALAVLAVCGLLGRFLRRDLCAFILDEPTFLFAAREQLEQQTWSVSSPLVGNQGFRYGPLFVWLESVVVAGLGPRPEVMLYVVTILLTAAHTALAWAATRALRGGLAVFGIVAGILAASPIQFFWSRLAWDNPVVNACVAWAIVLLTRRQPLTAAGCMALGLILGIAAGTHPMVLTFVGVVFAVLAWEGWRSPARTALHLALATGTMLTINIPYLRYLITQPRPNTPSAGTFSTALAVEYVLDAARINTAQRAEYLLDQDWSQFRDWLGHGANLMPGSSVATMLAVLSMAGITLMISSSDIIQRRLGLIALLTWFVHALFCAWRRLDLHPHYHQPSYWVIPLGMAALTIHAREHGYLRALLMSGLAVFISVQLVFLERWMRFIEVRGGTQGTHYSVPIKLQRDAVRRACESPAETIVFENRTQLFPVSIEYLASVEPRCEGKRVVVCRHDEGCPAVAPDTSIYRLEYQGAGGRLR